MSVLRSIRAIERAQVVVVLCDASEGVAEQDARLLGLCIERRRAIVVGLNKIDVIPRNKRKQTLEDARDVLAFARWAPLIGLSAKTGAGGDELARAVVTASEEIHRRIPTSALNRFFRALFERQPRRRTAVSTAHYYVRGPVSPQLFVAGNAPDSSRSYKRFVETNQEGFGSNRFRSRPVRNANAIRDYCGRRSKRSRSQHTTPSISRYGGGRGGYRAG